MRTVDRRSSIPRSPAFLAWLACVLALVGPSVFVWTIRVIGYLESCAPGPNPCRGVPLGSDLHDALAVAWVLPTNTFLLMTVAVAATIAGLFARRPLLAPICLLILPIAATMLPMLALSTAFYDGCSIDDAGGGNCILWGANLAKSFHTASQVPALIYGFAPYSFALALMMGLLGWFFSQPRVARSRSLARAHAPRPLRSISDR
jgi:hypothetical protein